MVKKKAEWEGREKERREQSKGEKKREEKGVEKEERGVRKGDKMEK